MATISIKPGVAGKFPKLTLTALTEAEVEITGDLVITSGKDFTINASNEVYSWTQFDETGKLQVPTTSTNSISTNIVVKTEPFFGDPADMVAGSAIQLGVFGLSENKTQVKFSINVGTKVLSGKGYITGLALTGTPDAPIWTTPVTLSVNGGYTTTTV